MDTKLPIPWPHSDEKDLLLGLFHYESEEEYGDKITKNREVMNRIDFTVIPKPNADLPITLVCNWGFPEKKYLSFSDEKITYTSNTHVKPGPVYVADFRGTIPPGYEKYFDELKDILNIDFFGGPYRNAEAPQPYVLSERIAHMGEYMFVIIGESIIENDWYINILNK